MSALSCDDSRKFQITTSLCTSTGYPRIPDWFGLEKTHFPFKLTKNPPHSSPPAQAGMPSHTGFKFWLSRNTEEVSALFLFKKTMGKQGRYVFPSPTARQASPRMKQSNLFQLNTESPKLEQQEKSTQP